ncbi:MAG: hypothetical protein HY255_10170 [Betaproteobacteria bacterium]|nr:hypothetical protein [Betaproteobacteria bacterium]
MTRFVFFLLLIANLFFAAHLYLSATRPVGEMPREVNPDSMKIASVTDPAKAAQDAEITRKLVANLSGSACVDFSIKPADAARAQPLFDAMALADRLSTRSVEEFSRFAVALPAQKDKRSADQLLASLRKAGVKDVSALGDNSISLGVFSSDEGARRYVAELEAKASALIKGLTVTPRNSQPKEAIFTIREPDTNLVARLSLMQREFDGSNLKAVACPAVAAAPAATAAAPAAAAPAATPAVAPTPIPAKTQAAKK